jgi:hypothetical protein
LSKNDQVVVQKQKRKLGIRSKPVKWQSSAATKKSAQQRQCCFATCQSRE